jgi:hypothetical protein
MENFPRNFQIGSDSLYRRFSSNVYRRQDHQCWNWIGAKTHSTGYGQIADFINGKRRNYRPHRLAWEYCFGPVEGDLVVRHMCHNRLCCNPTHLLTGTVKDNFMDKIKAKRGANSVFWPGERHPNSKLTQKQVDEIRAIQGQSIYAIADMYGVSKSLIGAIRSNKAWVKSFLHDYQF